MHAFVGPEATWYEVAEGRGHETLARLIGLDYAGAMIHDGWAPYDKFARAEHQQCLAHLLRRCRELLETATRGAVRFPRAVQALLREGLDARDLFQRGERGWRWLQATAASLTDRMRVLAGRSSADEANARFATFLQKHWWDCFTFLRVPGVDATNWRAEHAIRPAVVNRKVFGGHRTRPGARQLVPHLSNGVS
jgi:transposase